MKIIFYNFLFRFGESKKKYTCQVNGKQQIFKIIKGITNHTLIISHSYWISKNTVLYTKVQAKWLKSLMII